MPIGSIKGQLAGYTFEIKNKFQCQLVQLKAKDGKPVLKAEHGSNANWFN